MVKAIFIHWRRDVWWRKFGTICEPIFTEAFLAEISTQNLHFAGPPHALHTYFHLHGADCVAAHRREQSDEALACRCHKSLAFVVLGCSLECACQQPNHRRKL